MATRPEAPDLAEIVKQANVPDRGAGSLNPRVAGSLLQVVVLGVLTVLTLCLCAVLVLFVLFADGGALWDTSEIDSLREWMTAISSIAQNSLRVMIAAMFVFAVLAMVTVCAAWFRNRMWVTAGALNCALLGFVMACSAWVAPEQLSSAVSKTFERIGPVKLSAPIQANSGGSTGGAAAPQLPPPTTQDVRQEMMQLSAAAIAAAHGPYTTGGFSSEQFHTFLPGEEASLLLRESCTPAPTNEIGEQLSFAFSLPSDAEGSAYARVINAWEALGYGQTDRMRSESFFSKSGGALREISVNDHFTLDGELSVRLMSDCADVNPPGARSGSAEVR